MTLCTIPTNTNERLLGAPSTIVMPFPGDMDLSDEFLLGLLVAIVSKEESDRGGKQNG